MNSGALRRDFATRSVSGLQRLPWLPLLLCAAMLLIVWTYWFQTRLPGRVIIAGGPSGGRYDRLANALAGELESRLGLAVEVRQTKGSLENLHLLDDGTVDLGFYQPETRTVLEGPPDDRPESEPAFFVSNLYAEYLLPLAAFDHPEHELQSLSGTIWSSNDRLSGDFAMTQLLLDHLGANDDTIDVISVPYDDLPRQIRDGTVHVAIVCCGLQAPILQELFTRRVARPLDVPFVDAFADKHISLQRVTVPAGYFRIRPDPMPERDFETVALRAQLLANCRAPVRLVEEVTSIVLDPRFQRQQHLTELFGDGIPYATDSPEFTMHAGASHIYYPDLKPLVNPDFVEGTEGLRSFLVSIVVAVWFVRRWWIRRRTRSQEHRLDRYIRNLLQLERDQLGVDGENPDDYAVLQELLDKVTLLRQEVLSEFTAHELNEDRAVDCFIEMCHALSDKVSGKLIRHCLRHFGPVRSSMDGGDVAPCAD
ncbi:MAG: TAXI family TRAP transporter solute-binding subunit [Planctomycetaceae bacterium]